MKIIKDYNKAFEQLGLEDSYKRVYNRVSRVKRSLKRLKQKLEEPYTRNVIKQYYKIYLNKKMPKIRCKSLIVLDFMVDKIVAIYNGKKYISIKVKEEMLGRYLKEFVQTRTEGRKIPQKK